DRAKKLWVTVGKGLGEKTGITKIGVHWGSTWLGIISRISYRKRYICKSSKATIWPAVASRLA
ncbi:hypothetical protein, partial [Ruegeria lacuscaerulensis]|uniref:hypothetical protein n=1 Tax=Ruegeria lacuscaerulensis TaxID=55218 RepID=UPI001BE3E3E3